MIGSILVAVFTPLLDKMGVDDPVGASAVHGIGGAWGMEINIFKNYFHNQIFPSYKIQRVKFNELSKLKKKIYFPGVIAVGLFADNPIPLSTTNGRKGLLRGGGWYMLGIQLLEVLSLFCWSSFVTVILLYSINKLIPIRMDPNEELLGADLTEHR